MLKFSPFAVCNSLNQLSLEYRRSLLWQLEPLGKSYSIWWAGALRVLLCALNKLSLLVSSLLEHFHYILLHSPYHTTINNFGACRLWVALLLVFYFFSVGLLKSVTWTKAISFPGFIVWVAKKQAVCFKGQTQHWVAVFFKFVYTVILIHASNHISVWALPFVMWLDFLPLVDRNT